MLVPDSRHTTLSEGLLSNTISSDRFSWTGHQHLTIRVPRFSLALSSQLVVESGHHSCRCSIMCSRALIACYIVKLLRTDVRTCSICSGKGRSIVQMLLLRSKRISLHKACIIIVLLYWYIIECRDNIMCSRTLILQSYIVKLWRTDVCTHSICSWTGRSIGQMIPIRSQV